MPNTSEWSDKATLALAGKTVEEVRYLTDEEQDQLYWHQKGPIIIFTDGSFVFPSQDNEGNGPGALFTSDNELPTIPTLR